jgi:large subunit ribosomal protein L21
MDDKKQEKKLINKKANKSNKKPAIKKDESKQGTFAVIETGGKQYIVKKGDILKIERIQIPKKGDSVTFDKVLLTDDGKKTNIGKPYISGGKVEARFIEEGRNKKITILKYKNKTRYKVKRGHKQHFSKVEIVSV